MMWILLARAPAPDAAYWPGRRWLAALDAVAWPAIALWLLAQVPGKTGIMLPAASVLLALATLTRLRTALWLNQRYRFTTWRLGRVAVVLLVVGWMLKFSVH
jgi:hypothetical protein